MPDPTPLPHAARPGRILTLARPVAPPASPRPPAIGGRALSRLLAAATLAARYRQLFPHQAAWLEEEYDWEAEEAEEAFASMTETFLGRVEEHLFPVMTEVWEADVEDIMYSLNQIPIIPQGLEHWYYDQFDDYREPVSLLLHIEHNDEDEEGDTTLARVYPDLSIPLDLDLDRVRLRLEQMKLAPPLDGLVEAIHMVRHSADNIWMDYSMSDIAEMGYHLAWEDEETVQWLAESWQEAGPRLERVWDLVEWCAPQAVGVPDREKLSQVVTLLLDAHRLEKIDE